MDVDIWNFIGRALGFIAAAGAAGYGIFVFVGKKWIEAKFAEQHAEYIHAQNKEIEELRFKINSLFDRKTKIHAKEFDVIPKVWALLNDVVGALARFVAVFQQYPDVARMNNRQLEEFLETTPFSDYEKEQLRASEDKNQCYQNQVFPYDVMSVREKYASFRNFYKKNTIFLPKPLIEKINAIDESIWNSLLDREFGKQFDDTKKWVEANRRVRDEIEPILKELESEIHGVIHEGLNAN